MIEHANTRPQNNYLSKNSYIASISGTVERMCLVCVASAISLLAPTVSPFVPTTMEHYRQQPVDAVSVTLPSETAGAAVRGLIDGQWTDWQPLGVDNEQDPTLLESNLVMFPDAVTKIEVRGDVTAVHPIDISDEPAHYTVAALNDPGTPRILSREEWGADETLRYYTKNPSSVSSTSPNEEVPTDSGTGEPSQRVQDCNTAQANYPNEFKTNGRLVKEEDGHTLLWPRTYSKEIKLITVHHTAMQVEGDARSGVERMRALYQYHASNRGWGDIGYHYLIDEEGQIYEGKAGGKYVVGGHAYCNNINTLGIALLGNFEIEQPTQKQMKALQWLIADLADTYDIDLNKNVSFHGKTMTPVVGHRDLLSTDCPGFYAYGALPQVLAHAASGDLTADVRLPNKPKTVASKKTSPRKSARITTGRPNPSSEIARRSGRVSRLLKSDAALALRRKLGSNPGNDTEAGVAARRTARLSGSSVSRSSRSSVIRSSTSRSSKSSTSSKSSRSSGSSESSESFVTIRIRLTKIDATLSSCSGVDLEVLADLYRGTVTCITIDGKPAVINTLPLEEYLLGLAEEPDTEPYEKQRAFAIAARTYAAWYMQEKNRKFPNMPYDGNDSPASFQKYNGRSFEKANPRWLDAVASTSNQVLTYKGELIKPPYFSSNDGRTRSPIEAGWNNFPFAQIYSSKADPWCEGMELRGHGVGMSGCGAEAQAKDGKTGEEILQYYYPGTALTHL